MLCWWGSASAQQESQRWQRAEAAVAAGQYQAAFDMLADIERGIAASKMDSKTAAEERYKVARARMTMYMKMRRSERVKEQLEHMERHANASKNEKVKSDLLYNKAVYYYTFGQTAQGNAVFKEMAAKLMAEKEYDKVDDVYQMLIESGRNSGSAAMTAQAYSGYIAWKDSMNELKAADERLALEQKIAECQASIDEKDNDLAARGRYIAALCVLSAVLAAALVVGAMVLLRLVVLTRKQKKTIRRANENNALKAKFISNISAQLTPTLKKLDSGQPEVRALQRFAAHIQTLSQLETTIEEKVELEDTVLPPFCEELVNKIRDKVQTGVVLAMDVPNMSAMINKDYVGRVLLHLLQNAAKYTPANGHIRLEFKKRGAHKHQFLVSNTGSFIPEEQREDVFKAFLTVRDLTQGDGLGLPICQLMATKMNGEIDIDPEFTKGTRFVLSLTV